MNKKLLIGIIVVIIILVVFEIVAATRVILHAGDVMWFWIPLAGWIYLVWMVWKRKTNIFPNQFELKLVERRLKRLKVFLLVAGMSFAMFWLNILWGIVILNLPKEEPVSLFIALFSAVLFVIATIGGLVIFLKGR
jgi:hypothetical protein